MAGAGFAASAGFAGRAGTGRLIDAGGAADDGGVGDEGADVGVGAGVSVVEDAAGVVGGTGSAVVAFSLSSLPVIRVLVGSFRGFSGFAGEILIEAAGFDRGYYLIEVIIRSKSRKDRLC
jgi:hypothetical protein